MEFDVTCPRSIRPCNRQAGTAGGADRGASRREQRRVNRRSSATSRVALAAPAMRHSNCGIGRSPEPAREPPSLCDDARRQRRTGLSRRQSVQCREWLYALWFSSRALSGEATRPVHQRCTPHKDARTDYYDRGHHEAASKFLNQKASAANYSAVASSPAILGLLQPIRSGREGVCCEADR